MSTQVTVNQSTVEEKIYPLDFSPALLTDVTVSNAAVTYSGDNADDDPPVTDVTISENIAYVAVSHLAIGRHRLSVVAQTSNDDLSPEIMLLINTYW